MHASTTRLLRALLTFGAICGFFATCSVEPAAEALEEERRFARVTADEAGSGTAFPDDPATEWPGASDEPAAEWPGVSDGPEAPDGDVPFDGSAPAEGSGTVPAASPAVSEDPSADTLVAGVRGRVTVRGVGLGGVPIRLETAAGKILDSRSSGGRTDQRGFFGFESVPPGEHTVILDLPDPSGVAFADTSRTVRPESASTLARVDFHGRLLRDSEIRGVVRDRAGEPLEGVSVEVSGDALEGYATDLLPALASLSWTDTAVTGSDGRYAFDTPAGWYQVSIWRDEWRDTPGFLRLQYGSPMPAVTPGQTATANFDFRYFKTADCAVARLGYGDRVEREPGSMRCDQLLHPDVTRFEIWPFEGEAGDRVKVSADLSVDAPLLLMGPDSGVVSVAPDAGAEGDESPKTGTGAGPSDDEGRRDPGERVLTATLERSGTHYIVVTYAGPVWSTADSYRLRLSRGEATPASRSLSARSSGGG